MSIIKRKFNFCSKAKTPILILASFAVLGIPTDCAVKRTTTFCNNPDKPAVKAPESVLEIFSLYFHEKQSNVNANVLLNISHDKGFSCFEMSMKILSP